MVVARVDDVEVHPAVALGQEPDPLGVEPAERRIVRPEPADFPHPCVVVQRVEQLRPAGVGVHRHEPAILVVVRAHVRDRDRAVG